MIMNVSSKLTDSQTCLSARSHSDIGKMSNSSRTDRHDRGLRCEAHNQSCMASATISMESPSHSAYSFPRDFRELPSLDAAVRSAISHLPEAPFIQLRQQEATSHHAIDDSILQSSQLREGLNSFFRESTADLVMLVHPLSSPDASHSARQVDADGNIMTGIINSRGQQQLESFSDFLRRGGAGARAVLSGSIGDCCDEPKETSSQVVAFQRKKYAKYEQGKRLGNFVSKHEVCRYYGMILQSRKRKDSGCYVLKTMDSAVGDCTCTHWTLTRVSAKTPIYDQLCSAWLSN